MKKKIFISILILFVAYGVYFYFLLNVKPPIIEDQSALELNVEQVNDSLIICDDSWLKQNKYGLWEMYVAGSPFELGAKAGMLTQDLNYYQEKVFVDRLREMIPSESYLNKLKYGIAFFNRNMEKYIPLENQEEIFAYAQFASSDYDFIAPSYHRMLNYHGAHDIGHALQNLNLVACTALGVWDERTEDGSMIIARNFDFYMGEDFAKNKIVAFYKPDNGYPFMMITWAGMTGVLSGMNKQGLTVTLNAAKSEIPFSAKTPVSILARNILQHASTIAEAYAIANAAETFVSESFLIGSAIDGKAVVIEKSPSKIDVFDPGKSEIVLTNHFQSKAFKETKRTKENIAESATMYRYERVEELMERKEKHNVQSLASILRDPYGKNDEQIGWGNEMAVNQFIAHHGIIFKPEQKQVWISTHPYQMGKMIMYDLNKVFSDTVNYKNQVFEIEQSIPQDTLATSVEFANLMESRFIIWQYTSDSTVLDETREIEELIEMNPDYYYNWFIAAKAYLSLGDIVQAKQCSEKSLECEIPRKVDREQIEELLDILN